MAEGGDGGATASDGARETAGRTAKKRFVEPMLRVYTPATEIPDTFPGAEYFRAHGFRTYHDVFGMSPGELAAAEKVVGSEVAGRIAALRRAG